ncbi:transposase [Orientia tsutsugamushi]|nr:transposase [Orientia tsutsugamushi]
MKSDMNYEVVLIDATESPIEKSKKNKNSII